mmetsp:Transcript_30370/g.42639  ORF Transcript_30370/g.42639 Transcript_30370/m.42639 type:complete len:418 (+) Transcript_30370:155-1408(+)
MSMEDFSENDSHSSCTPIDESAYMKDIPADPILLEQHINTLLSKRLDPHEPSINGFDEEYYFIEMKTSHLITDGNLYQHALSPVNRPENRYSNVLPPDSTRVKLKEIPNVEGSDYINANWISGLIPGSERGYVATQGPLNNQLQNTLPSFWRMVWEIGASVIVMLTKEIENGKSKCDRYWPEDDCPLTVGHLKITLVNSKQGTDLIERTLEILNLNDDATRTVYQFQYIAWPDHGLPTGTHAFLDLAHKVDTVNPNDDPIVVHCSAGIGRSGTFCAVHMIVEKLRLELKLHPETKPTFNLVKTVIKMREQRPGMVQTKDQYMFCYLTILEETQRLFGKKRKNLVDSGSSADSDTNIQTYKMLHHPDNNNNNSSSEDSSDEDDEDEHRPAPVLTNSSSQGVPNGNNLRNSSNKVGTNV